LSNSNSNYDGNVVRWMNREMINISIVLCRNAHKCIKDLSPLKAKGDMDLIWLFSMNLEEKQTLTWCKTF